MDQGQKEVQMKYNKQTLYRGVQLWHGDCGHNHFCNVRSRSKTPVFKTNCLHRYYNLRIQRNISQTLFPTSLFRIVCTQFYYSLDYMSIFVRELVEPRLLPYPLLFPPSRVRVSLFFFSRFLSKRPSHDTFAVVSTLVLNRPFLS